MKAPTVRYEIRYRCSFEYDEAVAESQNELRVCPTSDERQTVLHASVRVEPTARVLTTEDYWGTRVDAFGIRLPHAAMTMTVEAVVDVEGPPLVEDAVRLEELQGAAFRDEHRELLTPSRLVEPTDDITALAAEVAPDAEDVVTLAHALCEAVEARIEHVTGVTGVGTSVSEVLAVGSGVCQDRAHLLVALCRERSIPARYVSGYLCAGPTGTDTTTHAWVEVAVPGQGWHTLDPSDGGIEDQRRVVIGRGRDYADVAPLRGTYVGADDHDHQVSVEITEITPVVTSSESV